MIVELGWSFEYIDEFMTLPRLYLLSRQWRAHPPVRHLLAAFIGFKAPTTEAIASERAPEPPEFED